jgi:hypothetical protein
MLLFPGKSHPNGMNAARFVELFAVDKQADFAFDGYQPSTR